MKYLVIWLIATWLALGVIAYLFAEIDPDFDEEVESDLRYYRAKLDTMKDEIHRIDTQVATLQGSNIEQRLEALEHAAAQTATILNAVKWVVGIAVVGIPAFIGTGQYYKRQARRPNDPTPAHQPNVHH